IDMVEGDWVFVPPFMPHVEANMSTTEELVWITTRTPENIVVNLDDVPDEQLEGYRRS
ncbi:cupin, partial [Geobacillus sp. MMMUD3]|nr:cupin [Geobacillus sp. MMMUD3]